MQKIQQDLLKAEATVKELTATTKELQSQIEAMKKRVEGNALWRPKHMEDYWAFNTHGDPFCAKYDNTTVVDHQRFAIGNCFPTKEAAELHVKKLKVIQKLKDLAGGFRPDFSNKDQPKWIIAKYHQYTNWRTYNPHPDFQGYFVLPYFASESAAQAAITTLGDELNCLIEGV